MSGMTKDRKEREGRKAGPGMEHVNINVSCKITIDVMFSNALKLFYK